MGGLQFSTNKRPKNPNQTQNIVILSTLIPALIPHFFLIFDEHTRNAISTGILSVILSLFLIVYILKTKRFPNISRKHLISIIIFISLSINGGLVWALVQPWNMIWGKIDDPNSAIYSNFEINFINPKSKNAGRAVIPDDPGNFLIKKVEKGIGWILVLNFTKDYLELSEFMAQSSWKLKDPTNYPISSNKYRLDPWEPIYFFLESDKLTEEFRDSVLELANTLKNNPNYENYRLLIHGHCCATGSPKYNYKLGQKRADRIRNALIKHGVKPERLISVSYGEIKLVKIGNNEALRSKNRRVECYFIPPNKGYTYFVNQNR